MDRSQGRSGGIATGSSAQARTFTGRTVFAALCDKLVDISPDLKIVPQLATAFL